MKRGLRVMWILVCIGALGSGVVMADPAVRGFGFGGAMAMAFFPDMTGINAFLSENGLDPMCDALIGAGGNGRGGVIGGPVFGGIGWGLVATSENDERHAELVFGGGGFDVGRAIGGNDRSVLTFGAVLGGGANVLTISGLETDWDDVAPSGIIPEPTGRELLRAVGFVQPYISMSAQLLPWMGFEFRIGYVLPLFGFDVGDVVGIPAPSLDLSGPTVSFGFVFGGIGSIPGDQPSQQDKEVVEVSTGSFPVALDGELVILNTIGDIVISAYTLQTSSNVMVEWQATRTAEPNDIAGLQASLVTADSVATLKTVGEGRIDYEVRIPSGLDLKVKNAVGEVTLVGHQSMTIILENGVGNLTVRDVEASALFVSGGVGRIQLENANAQRLVAEIGLGEIALGLSPSTSATLLAKAGIGDVSIDRFPVMTGGVRGFLGKTGDVILGNGERSIELRTGIGRIEVTVQFP